MTRRFTSLTGIAVPLLIDNINTDQITPAPTTRGLNPDYRGAWFARWRLDPDGKEIRGFVLNEARFRDAQILVVGRNFGCGSARESAVRAMVARGVRCIIARSFADLYRANCIQNGVLPIAFPGDAVARFEQLVTEVDGRAPFTVDLGAQAVIGPAGERFAFSLDEADRTSLLGGRDDIAITLEHAGDIDQWERQTAATSPWLQAICRQG